MGRLASIAVILSLVWASSPSQVAAAARISLSGTSGMLMTPTAEVVTDKEIAAGASFVDKKWALEGRGKWDNSAYFVTLGYLPRLEISMRLTVLHGSSFSAQRPDRLIKDRMFSVKALVLKENGHWPALALGGEDLTGTKRFNALFAVATKSLGLGRAGPIRLHLGAGSDWIEAKNHALDGVFGGVAVPLSGVTIPFLKGGELLAEYDTNKVNVGLRFRPVPHVGLLVSFLNAESFAGALHADFVL